MNWTDFMIAIKRGLIPSKQDLEAVQTTSKANLTTAGWYRVAEYVSTDTSAKGGQGNSCTLVIKRGYVNYVSEYYKIALNSIFDNQRFKVNESLASKQLFTKVRYTYSGNTAYLEVFYTEDARNNCTFTISNGNDYYFTWKAITPTLTQENVSGVTVVTTYDIPANVSPFTTEGGTVNGHVRAASEKAESRYMVVKNALRTLSFGVRADGSGYLYDDTNAVEVISFPSDASKVRTFQGVATRNLPLDGGGTVSASSWKPVGIKNTGSPTSTLEFSGNSGVLGYLGFNNADNPVFVKSNGSDVLSLLHIGNMADHVVPKTGGSLNQGQSIRYRLASTTMNAIGSWFENPDGSDAGGICALGKNGVLEGLYMAVSPYHYGTTKGLFVTADDIKWKGSEILHTGNMGNHVVTRNGDNVINGGLEIQKANAIPFSVKNTTADSSECYMAYTDGEGTVSSFGFIGGKPYINSTYQVFHTGNKPMGSYYGSGLTTQREVSIPCHGVTLMVYGADYFSIVTPYGAIGVNRNTGEIVSLKQSECSFTTGKLTIVTDSEIINKTGLSYSYQVL